MREIRYEGSFDGAHRLDPYAGKCRNLHGHTWRVLVVFEYDPEELDPAGLSIDFHKIESVVGVLDHQYLNEIIGCSASAENILEYLIRELTDHLPGDWLKELQLWESPTSSVRYVA